MASSTGALPFDAVLFDLDGVLTATAKLHEAAWRETLDGYLQERSSRTGILYERFTDTDYTVHLDGKLREDGVRDFLDSRGIELPEGSPDSPPDEESIWGIGNRKNARISELISPETIEVFPGSVHVVRTARARGLRTAVVSSSANCRPVLRAAGIDALFDTIVDGLDIARLGLPGKPAPDAFLEAARRLGVEPARTMVVEDAVAGVRAARGGGFGVVIGIDRRGNSIALRRAGAHIVVADLWSLLQLFAPEARGPKFHRLLRTHENLGLLARTANVEPWRLTFTTPTPELMPSIESLFALSNGYLGIRGSVEEGAPSFRPGALLNGFYESWPIVYGEDAYGFPHTGQTIVSAPDGMRMRLFVDDAHFDPIHDDLPLYERTLHLDKGMLERNVVWRLHDQARVAVRTRRIVSLVDRHLACVVFEVEALDRPVTVTVSSELAEPSYQEATDEAADPRVRRAAAPLRKVQTEDTPDGTRVAYTTHRSGLAMACGMGHVVRSGRCNAEIRHEQDVSRVVFTGTVEPGVPLRIEKYLAYHYSGTRFAGELLFRVEQTLRHARLLGAHTLFEQHERAFGDLWRDADVELEGSPQLQFAVRFNLFHLLQATARAEGHGVPAKGLTGEGYEGHHFWDTEMYVVPFLIYTRPLLARSVLLHRYHMLPHARKWARVLSLDGALFPWRTISGEEASANYASGTAQYHIDSDIAYVVRKYFDVTRDRDFLERYGAEMLVETARLYADLGYFSERKGGRFVINGVTGPDEYTTVVDNNLFTNLMARENLQMAAYVVDWMRSHMPESYDRLVTQTELRPDEPARWRRAAEAMYLPRDPKTGVFLQDEAFLDQERWDFEHTPPENYPLLLHYHPLVIYRHQVIKQPDVMLATFLLGNEFDAEQKKRVFDYYDPLTTGDSSLSECIQAVVACEVGEEEMAHRYLVDSAAVDLADNNRNVRDGIHLAACGGTWMAFVNGFAGLRDYDGKISFQPVLPPHWQRLRFRLRIRGSLLEVDLRQEEATYRLIEGEPLVIRHRGEEVALARGDERRLPFPAMPPPAWLADAAPPVPFEPLAHH